jgi:hypothetical protein
MEPEAIGKFLSNCMKTKLNILKNFRSGGKNDLQYRVSCVGW